MDILANLQETQVVLNQFWIKELSEDDCKIYEYTCNFVETPESGQEFKAIASVCYKLGVPATQFGNKIIAKQLVSNDKLKTDAWEIIPSEEKILNPTNNAERKAIEQLERKTLEVGLKREWRDATDVEKAPEGGFIWWVKEKGVGETKLGCLNLANDLEKYPQLVEECLNDVAKNSSTEIRLGKPRTSDKLPKSDLERQIFWKDWAKAGVQTILVLSPRLSSSNKQAIRIEALKAGIATQFMIPTPKDDVYKAMNVVLGLLAKAGWQAIRLEPIEHPQTADLVIGFDTGTNRELYYGTSAFAVLSDGQSLGWEIPDVQRGESFSGEAVWQTVSRLILRFREHCGRFPKRVLLMRDGLVQDGEFDKTIDKLKEENIEVDLIGVRKSGGGRMGREKLQDDQIVYCDADSGTVVLMPDEKSFLLVTTQARAGGSVRPLRVVHTYGNSPLELLAIQTYHLTKLSPASGYSSSRLPCVLHLADKSSKEFQRIGQMSILQNLNREKLIGV